MSVLLGMTIFSLSYLIEKQDAATTPHKHANYIMGSFTFEVPGKGNYR
jgi:hypothetical protein